MLSEKTKEKTKDRIWYWAKRLECPVDENANYENTYVRLSSTISQEDMTDGCLPSGATVTSFPSLMIDDYGHGKVSLAIGSLPEQTARHGQLALHCSRLGLASVKLWAS